jgi:CubicO group peptidase (beta-lactamase class C family)
LRRFFSATRRRLFIVKTFPPSDSPILPVPSPPPARDPSLEGAFAVLEDCVARGLVPGAVAAVGTAGETLHRRAFGWAALTPERRRIEEGDLFDVASLTKVVVTTTLFLRFLEQGRLYLDQPVATVLPAFGARGKEHVTFRHLLTHSSGLPSWKDLRPYGRRLPQEDPGAPEPLEAVLDEPLERPTRSAVVYSDLGFIALGAALSAVGGAPLERLARDEGLGPLGMAESGYTPHPGARERCVAT